VIAGKTTSRGAHTRPHRYLRPSGQTPARRSAPGMPAHLFSSNERKPLMITITAILNTIEAHAERAIVPELRLIKKDVEKLRSSLYPDDQEHADALLLKLDRLLSDQVVVATEAGVLAQGIQTVAQAA
jgi:hypothetical protein